MAVLTTLQKINVAKLSQAYAIADIVKSGLYGGGIDLELPRKIYCLRKSIEYIYDLDPADDTLTGTTNYLIQLCGKYYLQAYANLSGGGTVVVPSGPLGFEYLIPILGSDFTDATNYDDGRIIGKSLAIFWNDVSRYLLANEWEATASGINILVAGFSATDNPTYELFIYIIDV